MPASDTVSILFIVTVIACYAWLCSTLWISLGKRSMLPLALVTLWIGLQAFLVGQGFYRDNMAIPPHFIFAIAPPILLVFLLSFFWSTRKLVIALPILPLLFLHSIRLPVEVVLWGLYKQGLIPRLMTFEGGNLDILSGITAPIIGLLWLQGSIGKRGLFLWNISTLALLINIVLRAVLSAHTPFQKLAFDQPNVGVTLFPYIWLPTFIVPTVLFCHVAVLMKLWMENKYEKV